MNLPEAVNICGVSYSIEYKDNPSEVDIHKRESLWGQIDYWTRTIRIYDNGQPVEDVFQCILHEVIHGVASMLHLEEFEKKENHDELDVLAVTLGDVLLRNEWVELEDDA